MLSPIKDGFATYWIVFFIFYKICLSIFYTCAIIYRMENTIVAISTPIGVGGISIVRVSGVDALKIASKVFSCKTKVSDFVPRYMYFGTFHLKNYNEKCLCVYFKAPHSYTGEDLVEFQCHGGVAITKEILTTLLENGCRLAEGGEFTKRAFLNGKISLDEAEGVMDIISAESDSELKAGYNLMDGNLHSIVNKLQKELTDTIAFLEVVFDYPEHDIEEITTKKVKSQIEDIKQKLGDLIATHNTGMQIKNGCRVVILGRPNVGKSSLMNALLNFDRAIVTDIQGTTRDTLEETYVYNGVKFVLTDTAGVRDSKDIVEKIGIEKAKNSIKSADLVLLVLDGSEKLTKDDVEIIDLVKNKKVLVIVNKIDLSDNIDIDKYNFSNVLRVSATNKTNIDKVKQKIYDMIIDENILSSNVVITSTRHYSILRKAYKVCDEILSGILSGNSVELISIDLNNLWLTLGEITGETNNEEIINSIFKNFCVGK